MSRDLRGRERGAVEVEGQLVRADEGALLRGFLADDFVQRPVQQVRDGVVPLDGAAARAVELDGDVLADGGRIGFVEEVQPGVAALLRIGDAPGIAAVGHLAGVADLPAHLGVAHGVVGNDTVLPFTESTSCTSAPVWS